MRVAIFSSNYPPHPGGLEVVVHQVASGLAARHDVVVVTSAWNGLAGVSEEDGLTVYRLRALHASERWGVPYPVPVGGMRDALSAVKGVEVVQAHGALYASTLLAAWTARRLCRPLVLTEHVGFVRYSNPGLNSVQRGAWATVGGFVVRSACAITTYNTRVVEWLSRHYPLADIHFIPNGVDTRRFRPRSHEEQRALRRRFGLPEHETLALFVGRQAEKKNLDAVLRIPRDGFTMVVCGAVRDLHLERVVDLGVVPYAQMPDLFGAVDLMIHASTGEGFPLAVQEAMAAGVPMVLLWDEGYSRTLDPGVVSSVRALADLANSLTLLVRDGDRRKVLGRAGRLWAEQHWDWSVTVHAYEQLFRDAIQKARRVEPCRE